MSFSFTTNTAVAIAFIVTVAIICAIIWGRSAQLRVGRWLHMQSWQDRDQPDEDQRDSSVEEASPRV